MPRFGTRELDIRDQNVAVERELERTDNPRHRYLLQQHWTKTDQCVFYVEDESVAVGDHLIVGRGIGYQQRLGAELAAAGADADAQQAGELLDPLIKPLPPFDASLLPH